MAGSDVTSTQALFAERLQEKVQQQALELSACRSHVVWSSQVALSCEQYCQHLDPSVDLSNVAAALVRYSACVGAAHAACLDMQCTRIGSVGSLRMQARYLAVH